MNGWENFFIAEIAASAPLARLVLVGVSLNLEQIMAHPVYGLPGRALEALVMLLAVLVISTLMLVPEQTLGVIGAEVLGVGLQSILGTQTYLDGCVTHLTSQFHGGGFAVQHGRNPTSEVIVVEKPSIGVMDDNYLVRAQQTLGVDEGADSVVGDSPACVPYHVRFPHLRQHRPIRMQQRSGFCAPVFFVG